MKKEERRNQMVEIINQSGTIGFAALKARFPKVSEMTLRRDLEFLDQAKRILRIHGGAKSVDVLIGTDDLFSRRALRNSDQKRQIARAGLSFLKPNISVYLDSGTSVTELAHQLPDGPYLLFTNSLTCAAELARLKLADVYILGGRMNRYSLSINGTRSISFLENINFDLAFMGVTGYVSGRGFSCGAEEEYEIKREVIRRSEKVVMLMDSKKIGYASTFTMARPEEIHAVVTDDGMGEDVLREMRTAGVEVIVAPAADQNDLETEKDV